MAEDKTSFLLYADIIHTVSKLPDDKAGILFKTILDYVNDKNPIVEDLMVDLVFEPIKQQLKRDLKHWENIKEKRSEAGKISALKKAKTKEKQQKKAKSTSVKIDQQTSTNSTVSVNVNDNVNVIVINREDKSSPLELAFIDFVEMRKKIKKPATEKALGLINKKLFALAQNDEEKKILIIEQSIRNSWQDVFPLRNDNNNQQQQISKAENLIKLANGTAN